MWAHSPGPRSDQGARNTGQRLITGQSVATEVFIHPHRADCILFGGSAPSAITLLLLVPPSGKLIWQRAGW